MSYLSVVPSAPSAPSIGAFDPIAQAIADAKKAQEAAAAKAAADAKAKALADARAKARTELAAIAKARAAKVAADVKAGKFDPPADAFEVNLYKQAWLATGTPLPAGVSPPDLPTGGPGGDVNLPSPPSNVPMIAAGVAALAVVAFLLMRKKG